MFQRSGGQAGLWCVLAGALMLAATPVDAAQFTVTNNNDSGAGSLRQAVLDANATAGADEIGFDEGLGTITLTSGQIEITDDLSIVGPSGRIRISGANCSRVLWSRTPGGGAVDLVLENVVLADGVGTATCNGTDFDTGGAMFAAGTISLVNSRVVDSTNESLGGGIYFAGEMVLIDSVVSGNHSVGRGGGISGGGPSLLRMVNSRVVGNVTVGDAARGGGITFFGELQLENAVVANNRTLGDDADGAGLNVNVLSAKNSAIFGNRAGGEGTRGGGMYVVDSLEIINSTIANNVAKEEAGGIYLFGASGESARLYNTTVFGNQAFLANDGVNLGTGASIDIHSSILAGNGEFGDNFDGDGPANVYNSVFGDPAEAINGDNIANVFTNEPGLGALADHGCAVPAVNDCVPGHLPQAGTPALDTGSNPLAQDSDQRGAGFPRVIGAAADSGAMEVSLPKLVFSQASLDFGDVALEGPGSALAVTLRNEGTEDLDVGSLLLGAPDPDPYSIELDNCSDATLTPGAECNVEIRFDPADTGVSQATLLVPWNDPNGPAELTLTGRGVVYLAQALPSELDFGGVRIGTTTSPGQGLIVFQNYGNGDLQVEGVDLVGAHPGDFEIASDGCTGAVLLVNQECSIEVTATPSVLGSRTASLLVASNASNAPTTVALTMSGTQEQVAVSRERIVFPPSVRVGDTTDRVGVVYTNEGTAPAEFGSPTIAGDNPSEFTITDDTCSGQTVQPDDFCFLELNATPADEGMRFAELILPSSAASSPHTVELIAEGLLPEVGLTPSGLQFSVIQGDTGPTRSSRLVVTAGRIDLSIEAIGSPQGPFTITGGSCMDRALPATLPALEQCDIVVRFDGDDIGDYESSFRITTDAPSSPDGVTLFGRVNPPVVPTLGGFGLAILALMVVLIGLRRQMV